MAAGTAERPAKRARTSSAGDSGAGPSSAVAPSPTGVMGAEAQADGEDDSSDGEDGGGSQLGDLWAAGDDTPGS